MCVLFSCKRTRHAVSNTVRECEGTRVSLHATGFLALACFSTRKHSTALALSRYVMLPWSPIIAAGGRKLRRSVEDPAQAARA